MVWFERLVAVFCFVKCSAYLPQPICDAITVVYELMDRLS